MTCPALACFWASLLERSNAVVGLADGSVPVFENGTIKEFYFGGDGPHYGTRNSSLALIEFREATLAGVGAQPHCEYSNGSGWAVTLAATLTVVAANRARAGGRG